MLIGFEIYLSVPHFHRIISLYYNLNPNFQGLKVPGFYEQICKNPVILPFTILAIFLFLEPHFLFALMFYFGFLMNDHRFRFQFIFLPFLFVHLATLMSFNFLEKIIFIALFDF